MATTDTDTVILTLVIVTGRPFRSASDTRLTDTIRTIITAPVTAIPTATITRPITITGLITTIQATAADR